MQEYSEIKCFISWSLIDTVDVFKSPTYCLRESLYAVTLICQPLTVLMNDVMPRET